MLGLTLSFPLEEPVSLQKVHFLLFFPRAGFLHAAKPAVIGGIQLSISGLTHQARFNLI